MKGGGGGGDVFSSLFLRMQWVIYGNLRGKKENCASKREEGAPAERRRLGVSQGNGNEKETVKPKADDERHYYIFNPPYGSDRTRNRGEWGAKKEEEEENLYGTQNEEVKLTGSCFIGASSSYVTG